MSLESAPYYWLKCDVCGDKSTEGDEYSAWETVDGAEENARDCDWLVRPDKHLCGECRVLEAQRVAVVGQEGQEARSE